MTQPKPDESLVKVIEDLFMIHTSIPVEVIREKAESFALAVQKWVEEREVIYKDALSSVVIHELVHPQEWPKYVWDEVTFALSHLKETQ